MRTRSGRLRTTLIGNPEIRFQPNESVQKTIYNTIRYSTDPESKAMYQAALGKKINKIMLLACVKSCIQKLFYNIEFRREKYLFK